MSFEEIAQQDYEIRPQRLNLGHAFGQPSFTYQRADVKVGEGDEHRAIQLTGQAGKSHLVMLDDRRAQPLDQCDHGKHGADDQRPAAESWRTPRDYEAEAGDDIRCQHGNEHQEQRRHPGHAEQFQCCRQCPCAAVSDDAPKIEDDPEYETRYDQCLSWNMTSHKRH